MSTTSESAASRPRPRVGPGLLLRFALLLLLAYGIGIGLNRMSAAFDRRPDPAGFRHGMVQGALMPCTWPALLMGRDVTIYSLNNNGVFYKLGYTLGVNLCGAAFFGLLYRRVSKLRRWLGPKPV